MSKELPYFRFTASEWLNDDISLESFETKGIFIDICAYYWFKDCSVPLALLEKRFSNCQATIKHLLEIGIIKLHTDSDFIDINFLNIQYDLLSESRKRRQDAGSKGGKKKRSNAKAMLKQSCSYKDKDNNKENDNKNDNKKYKNIPPLLEEINIRIKERLITSFTAEAFFAHYNSNGWMVGKNKMKDWDSALTTWNSKKFNNNENNSGNNKRSIKRVNDIWN